MRLTESLSAPSFGGEPPFRASPILRPRLSRSCRKMSPRTSPPQKSFARSARKRTPSCTFSSRVCGESSPEIGAQKNGGEGGIRTLDTLLRYTHFPGVLLKPLGQLSNHANVVNLTLNTKSFIRINITIIFKILKNNTQYF